VAIPASIVSDIPHLREKTSRIGLIGRTAAIFRVDEIIVYLDNPRVDQKVDMNLIATLLSYMETPQYLRKRLFGLKQELRYAGVLPPLRTPHHPLNSRMRKLKIGEHREGVVLSRTKTGVLVDIGVEQAAVIQNRLLPVGKRVTVKVTKVDKQIEAETVNRDEIAEYWGYRVTKQNMPFTRTVRKRGFDLMIATSKYGIPFAEVVERLGEKWQKADNVLVAFGAPAEGLYKMVEREGFDLDAVIDFVVNTIPLQGTETVRTEEAVVTSLAILNIHFRV
jgi:predicted SPOUT superfamily RNA methylase MTH1